MSRHLTPIYISAISTISDLLRLVEEVKETKHLVSSSKILKPWPCSCL